MTDEGSRSTYYLDLVADTIVELIPGGFDARYVSSGHVLHRDADGGFWAVPFDLSRGALTGEAVQVLNGLSTSNHVYGIYSVSDNGTLVYGVGGSGGRGELLQELVVVSLAGDEQLLPLAPRSFSRSRWSPGGDAIVYSGANVDGDQSDRRVYLHDVDLGTRPERLTEGGTGEWPIWSPDRMRIAFTSNRPGTDSRDLFVKSLVDDSPATPLLRAPSNQFPYAWSAGDQLLFRDGRASSGDLWTMDVSDSSSAAQYLPSESSLRAAAISPEGDYAAYSSDESGTREVYVRSFPTPRRLVRVSQGGGDLPRWSPDGRTLYYWKSVAGPDSLFAARVTREPTFAVQSTDFVLAGDYNVIGWDLHPDGDRFIVPRNVQDGDAPNNAGGDTGDDVPETGRYILVVNWFTELRAASGAGGWGRVSNSDAGIAEDAASEPDRIIVMQNWFEELKRLVRN